MDMHEADAELYAVGHLSSGFGGGFGSAGKRPARFESGSIAAEVDRRLASEAREKAIAEELERKKRALEQLGSDIYRNSAVIRFTKTFVKDGKEYLYAAIKVDGSWYTSGPKAAGKAFSWDELCAWLVSGDVPTTSIEQLH